MKKLLRVPLVLVNVLVLHGPPPKPWQLHPVYRFLVGVFESLGAKPAGVFGHDPESTKEPDIASTSFAAWSRRLATSGFPESIDAFSMTAIFPILHAVKVRAAFGFDREFTVSFDCLVRGFDRLFLVDIARRLWTLYTFEYGYALQLPRRLSPWFYGAGNLQLDHYSPDARKAAFRWAQHRWREEKAGASPFIGVFRDVFPVNVLRHQHLERRIEGVRLRDWIEKAGSHGTLEHLNDDVYIWLVPDDSLSRIRAVFVKENMLVAYAT